MQASLWMILEYLKPYDPVTVFSTNEERTIENVRLYVPEGERKSAILYIESGKAFFPDNPDYGDEVVCVHGANHIRLNTTDVYEVFNRLLSFYEWSQSWYFELTSMLSSHCLLKDILNHFDPILRRPLMVLDASQIVLASSDKFGVGSIDPSWDHMLDTGSFGLQVLEEYNRLHQKYTSIKDAYIVPAAPFPHPSYTRNIFVDNEFIGFITMILKGEDIQQYEKDWFDLLCEAVFSWISLYTDKNELAFKQAMFKELLEGDLTNRDRFVDALNALGWSRFAKKRLLALSCLSSYLNMGQHIARIINQKPDRMYAITYDQYIVVLLNEDMTSYQQALLELEPLLHNSGYCGGSSNSFEKGEDLADQFLLARIALNHCPAASGKIYDCSDYVMPYVFEVLRSNLKLDLCHPAILRLRDYDNRHGTDLYSLLYIYLANERNQTKTAEAVCMHRNSLIRKITQIQEICQADLSDYQTRFHLLMSFEYQMQL